MKAVVIGEGIPQYDVSGVLVGEGIPLYDEWVANLSAGDRENVVVIHEGEQVG